MSRWLDTAGEIALNPHVRLTPRQQQCLALAARGLSSRSIAERLGLSARTIDEHLLRACLTLGVRTRIQAVALVCALTPNGASGPPQVFDMSVDPRQEGRGSRLLPPSG